MSTLHQWQMPTRDRRITVTQTAALKIGPERRKHRRHDLEHQGIVVERWDAARGSRAVLGRLVDLSAGGMRLRTSLATLAPDQQVKVRLELPAHAGICPFIDMSGATPQPRRDWVGWMTLSRVQRLAADEYHIAGRLVDMEEMDRGMLGLYLSTHPLAA